jgi:choline dehydrogenase-like flavoprotein
MLLAQRERPDLFGGVGGHLGRGYTGHLTGTIADLVPADRSDIASFCFLSVDGVLARRRIRPTAATIIENELGNIACWLDSPAISDPAHGSSVASAKYLAAVAARRMSRSEGGGEAPLQPHFANIARAPVSAVAGVTHALALHAMSRLSGRHPHPRRLLSSGKGGYRLLYHAEQFPDPANRVSLSADGVDSIGLPKLQIDYRFSERDCASVVRAHRLLNDDLTAAGAGRLRMSDSDDELQARVLASARDGYHQIGGAMMSKDPTSGVVDTNARVHGLENLWVASSSIFPTGGQANPTMTIVAFARRLADHIAGLGTTRRNTDARLATT